MGKVIESIALNRGHEISLKVDKDTKDYDLSSVDVAIDFSTPKSAVDNIRKALESKVPVISGTTGWLSELEAIKALCKEKKGAFIYASNFSIGVNIFFELNKSLAKMINNLTDYNIDLEDVLIIYDDLSLPLGKIRLREQGSSGGHNGIKSIISHLKTDNFKRIKVGIDSNDLIDTKDYVLGKFSKKEMIIIKESISIISNIIDDFMDEKEFVKIMNTFN